ncbi:hypothetical protein V1Y59_20560 [Gordonia sp. PKS22-38]|uniref:Uncharacterized protein n=1 Tax=Gordonia prachuapensis TaxID=3115651 RepID=A0ABU7MYR4_9ACTN|nr:hypothetical protein [Gordonia sp. PKS22-38]
MSAKDIATHALSGALSVNAVPHVVSGLLGRRFTTPFASPPGRGLSSPTVNAAWGMANAIVAIRLFNPGEDQAKHAAYVAGAVATGLVLSTVFGRAGADGRQAVA